MKTNTTKLNLNVQKKHSRDLWVQILMPVLVMGIAFLGLAVLAMLNTGKSPEVNGIWAGISLILILFPFLVIGIVLLAVIVLTIALVSKAPAPISRNVSKLADLVANMSAYTRQLSSGAVKPMISLKSKQAGVEKFISLIFKSSNKSQENK